MRSKAKKRELPLGTAIGLGLAATLAVGLLMATALLLTPGTAAHQFYALVHGNSSATLPLDPLYQNWAEKMGEEDALIGTPLSLLCGGLALGWLAPNYVVRQRVLLSGAALGFGVMAVTLTFQWVAALNQQNTLNVHEGGQQVALTAPPDLILRQAFLVVVWTAICVLGTWLGRTLRERSRSKQDAETPSLHMAGR